MKKHKHSFRSSIRFLLTFLMVLALIVPVAGTGNTGSKVSAQAAALTALEIFTQISLDIRACMAPNPHVDNTAMPAGLPAGSIALFQIYGVLDSDIAALEWNIGKPPVTVCSANGTQIVDAPKKGDMVKVYALRTIAPGPLVVEEIKLVQAGPVAVGNPETHLSFLFNGDAGPATVATMTVGGVSFTINDPKKPAIMSDGIEGPVTVRFDTLGTGAIAPVTPVVKPPETPAVRAGGAAADSTITGIVNNISANGNRYTVGTTVVVVNATTKVENFPMVGDDVQVRGQLQLDGSIIASRVRAIGLMGNKAAKPAEVKPAKPAGKETRFTGIVNGTGTDMWMIGLTPVAINADTKIRDNPAFGQMAEVRGNQQPDGIVLATQIRGLGGSGGGGGGKGGAPVRFTAIAEAIASSSWLVGGFTVTIDGRTKIKDKPVEGNLVEVRATQQADGSMLATEIRNLDKGAPAAAPGAPGTPGAVPGAAPASGSGSGSSGSGSGSGGSGSGSGSSGSGSGSSGSGSGSSGSGSGGDSSGSGSGSSGSGSGSSGSGSGSSGSGSGSSGSGSGSSGSGSGSSGSGSGGGGSGSGG